VRIGIQNEYFKGKPVY